MISRTIDRRMCSKDLLRVGRTVQQHQHRVLVAHKSKTTDSCLETSYRYYCRRHIGVALEFVLLWSLLLMMIFWIPTTWYVFTWCLAYFHRVHIASYIRQENGCILCAFVDGHIIWCCGVFWCDHLRVNVYVLRVLSKSCLNKGSLWSGKISFATPMMFFFSDISLAEPRI